MNRLFTLLSVVSGLVFTSMIFISYTSTSDEADNKPSKVVEASSSESVAPEGLPQVIKAADLTKTYTFAGEVLPLDNFDAVERFDRELMVNSYWQSNTLLNIKRANRFFPTMERILAENGVPDDFKYLAVAESNLMNAVSPSGARGFWQFMKLSGKEYGLEINDEVDERYHLEKSTQAACEYIKWLKSKFGTWFDAAAAYNVGPTRYKSLLASQDQEHYFDLNLNSETSRYVFRLMAIKEIMSNPSMYGFYLEPSDMYKPFENVYQVEISKSVPSWSKFAEEHGISYRILKVYNPWLRDKKLTVMKNKYLVTIPKES
ncbi:lytic transglycosylase domain-containing protein [Portibacter lacus]|uniref:Murein transglycosylase n=1 Tax=Portibacter lacus TaxID=1099794 RepID=A0AA37SS32_9BACT|nr:lytic transglycosylase domain-containing protein [Portibacter lacus]GLR18564.1 murein transglycosylase [Portibacter lacus]